MVGALVVMTGALSLVPLASGPGGAKAPGPPSPMAFMGCAGGCHGLRWGLRWGLWRRGPPREARFSARSAGEGEGPPLKKAMSAGGEAGAAANIALAARSLGRAGGGKGAQIGQRQQRPWGLCLRL